MSPETVDVVVVGGGLAGCAAMLAATEQGRSVALLEKQPELGGSTVLSAGLSAFAGTEEQAAQGIEDSVELLRADIVRTGLGLSDDVLVDLYCDSQLRTYNWLRGYGIDYGAVHAASGQSVPRSHPTDTWQLLKTLVAAAKERGARVTTGVKVRRLLRESERVAGVEVDRGSGTEQIRADAVVLGTGGFSRNAGLLARFAPHMNNALVGGGEGSNGDGLLMAWQLGAGIVDTPHIKGTYGIYPEPDPGESGTGILAIYKGAIAVNGNGRRFVDESLPYKVIGDISLAQPGGVTYQIFDAGVMDASDGEVPIYDLAGRDRSGLLVRAASLTDLAERLGMPRGELERTVADYNERTDRDEPDPWGRAHLSGTVGQRRMLSRPPFYAHLSGTVVLATYCGLTVGADLGVVDVFGEPIHGLYAAGEVVGGFHGGGYMTGTSIGKAAIFGRLAGIAAAQRSGVSVRTRNGDSSGNGALFGSA